MLQIMLRLNVFCGVFAKNMQIRLILTKLIWKRFLLWVYNNQSWSRMLDGTILPEGSKSEMRLVGLNTNLTYD